MSKRLDLMTTEEKGGTSHQAALVIGGIKVINTGIGYIWAMVSQALQGNGLTARRIKAMGVVVTF
jgi:hypothetical protein